MFLAQTSVHTYKVRIVSPTSLGGCLGWRLSLADTISFSSSALAISPSRQPLGPSTIPQALTVSCLVDTPLSSTWDASPQCLKVRASMNTT